MILRIILQRRKKKYIREKKYIKGDYQYLKEESNKQTEKIRKRKIVREKGIENKLNRGRV